MAYAEAPSDEPAVAEFRWRGRCGVFSPLIARSIGTRSERARPGEQWRYRRALCKVISKELIHDTDQRHLWSGHASVEHHVSDHEHGEAPSWRNKQATQGVYETLPALIALGQPWSLPQKRPRDARLHDLPGELRFRWHVDCLSMRRETLLS